LKYLDRNFAGGKYTCAYEAGFCGFWIARELKKYGVECLVVNPADVPTRDKERVNKKDKVDSRKLARELEKGNLEGIYIPDEWMQRLKSLGRLSISCGRDMTRIKNRIKSHLHLYGIEIPSHSECYHWSGNFIRALEGMCRKCDPFGDYMNACIEKLKAERVRQAGLLKKLRGYAHSCGWVEILGRLISIPVVEGQDGRLWSFPFIAGELHFYNIPNYLAASAESCMVPREIAEKDQLEIVKP
ncbi:MAG: transposase, partial [Lentisphaerota bacterium]